jgi:hypothetical protein
MKEVHEESPFLCIMPFQVINMDDTTQVIYNGTKDQDKPNTCMMH